MSQRVRPIEKFAAAASKCSKEGSLNCSFANPSLIVGYRVLLTENVLWRIIIMLPKTNVLPNFLSLKNVSWFVIRLPPDKCLTQIIQGCI